MYDLTDAEAATILSILSKGGGSENSDIGLSGIPASTFYATRRRIYEAGWLSDRYVPHPWANGFRSLEFVLARPGPVDRARSEREMSASPENVLLWSGPNVLFGVYFRRTDDGPKVPDGTRVAITADSGSLPAYFDFSRSWSRFVRVEKATGYPRAFEALPPNSRRSLPNGVPGLVNQDRGATEPAGAGRRWHSSTGLSRSDQGLLERGVVHSRSFLNLEALPRYEGRALGEIVFLTGELRDGVSSTDLLAALSSECQVSPILLADDGARALVLALGQTGPEVTRRMTIPRAAGPVTATLDARLKNVQMVVESCGAVRKIVDHRYDRLFPFAGGSGESRLAPSAH